MSRILVDDLHKGWLKTQISAHVRRFGRGVLVGWRSDRSAHSRRTDPGAVAQRMKTTQAVIAR